MRTVYIGFSEHQSIRWLLIPSWMREAKCRVQLGRVRELCSLADDCEADPIGRGRAAAGLTNGIGLFSGETREAWRYWTIKRSDAHNVCELPQPAGPGKRRAQV